MHRLSSPPLKEVLDRRTQGCLLITIQFFQNSAANCLKNSPAILPNAFVARSFVEITRCEEGRRRARHSAEERLQGSR